MVARNFCQELVRADPDARGQAALGPDQILHLLTERDGRPGIEPLEPSAHVEIRFVHGNLFDHPAEPDQQIHDRMRFVPVGLHPGTNKYAVRANPVGGAGRHGGSHAELPGLVARRADHSAPVRGRTHDDRPAAQRRRVALLDGREERIHIQVKNDTRHALWSYQHRTGSASRRNKRAGPKSAFDARRQRFHNGCMWNSAHEHIRDLVAYEPGKPVEELAREMGLDPSQIIKLASNENPLGPSPLAVAAMRETLERAHFYPDGGGWALRNAIAEKLGVARENVVLGNGSNEIIEFIGHAFLRPGDEVVTAGHAFAVYRLMAQLFGAKTVEVPDPGYTHDLDAMLAAITPKTRQLFIANPNNPTGTMVGQEALDRFMARVPNHVLVIFDEAYHEFLDAPPDVIRHVREGRNVVVMRTFSKIQGLANLRIGYGIAPEKIASVLQKTRQPFNANGIAQAGALAGLADTDHMRRTREITHEGRNYLQAEFSEMRLEFVPSVANFVLVRVGDGDAVFQSLLRRGVIVRAMRSYKMPAWIRVSVGTADQNHRFISELKAIDAAGGIPRGEIAAA